MPTSVSDHPWRFQTAPKHPTEALLDAAKWFCADIKTGQPPYWLCIIGNSGTGKTHIAKGICQWFKLHAAGEPFVVGENVIGRTDYRYRTWSRIMAKLYNGEYDGISDILSETLLVIDDFGAAHDPSKYGVSKLLEIMNRREGKWTVFTSNMTMEQIADTMDTRIASRFIRDGSKVIEMNCKDHNL
jgi:DNA replication protein DnaC